MYTTKPNHSLLLLISLLLFGINVAAQKKKIDYTAYDSWSTISKMQLSETGKWVTYEINPLEGDGLFFIKKHDGSFQKQFYRGKSAKISKSEEFVAFLIKPEHDTIRQLKLDKVKKIKFPKDTLCIYWTASDSTHKYPNISVFKIAKEANWLAFMSTKDLRPKFSKKTLKKKRKKGYVHHKTTGKTLYLLNPITKKKRRLHRVKEYVFDRSGKYLAYTTSIKGEKDSLSVHIMRLADFEITTIIKKQLSILKLNFDFKGEQLIFLNSTDTANTKNYVLSYWKTNDLNSKTLIDSSCSGMNENWAVSKYFSPYFSRDGTKIFLGVNAKAEQAPEDTLLPIEKARVDVWSGTDLRIQPEQLKKVKRDKEISFQAVFHMASDKLITIGDKKAPRIRTYNFANSNFGLATDRVSYSREKTWAFPWKTNYYKVNLENGERELIKSELLHGGSLSPSGEIFVWFNGSDSSWMATNLSTNTDLKISSHIKTNLSDDNNGMPFVAYPQGSNGWMKINNEEYYIIKDFYDIWVLNPLDLTKSFSLTKDEGVKNEVRFSLIRTETDSVYLTFNNCLLKGVNDLTKDESLYSIGTADNNYEINKLHDSPHRLVYIKKAKIGDNFLIRRSSFTTYPDLESTDITFAKKTQLTDSNPQQEEYNWGTVEFVNWKAYDSLEVRGLLYKPEDFDPSKKYPMIVYFYEQYQDNIHFYYSPKPTASIIYPTEYASNGYIIFIPDVKYEAGHPAKGAYNCIVSGTDYLLEKYNWIDSTKLGLQGQSWGGYQTAQLITMTTKYRAAMAGAPVSNMFSAYGGVRWGSGLSRMFQYERTQSRIGNTIWERPDLYIENSPIFGIPNITTPLLIMHNDNDGAVPWYQGIEMYMGMRRLDKTVWMLNYNGDQHNLTRLANKRDLSRRMRQFFDHYLLDAPMPSWMKNGLPATEKGIDNGFELEK